METHQIGVLWGMVNYLVVPSQTQLISGDVAQIVMYVTTKNEGERRREAKG